MAALVSEYTLEFFTLLNARGKKELIEWCMKEGLIASSYECPKCNEQMGLNERKSVVLDGFEWRCRKKGTRRNEALDVSDVVQIGHDNVRRIDWPLGVVLEVYPCKDEVPRVGKIRTSHGERIRPFQRLYSLEVSAKIEIGVFKASGKDNLPVEKNPESSTGHVSDSPTDYAPDSPVVSTDNSEEKPPTKTRLGRTIKIPCKLDLRTSFQNLGGIKCHLYLYNVLHGLKFNLF
ncbi:DUF5641 domain-containing protein [Trichonephila clavipes]|nr:DUF5641 domain-containing protein [Trichonephila clavipes]